MTSFPVAGNRLVLTLQEMGHKVSYGPADVYGPGWWWLRINEQAAIVQYGDGWVQIYGQPGTYPIAKRGAARFTHATTLVNAFPYLSERFHRQIEEARARQGAVARFEQLREDLLNQGTGCYFESIGADGTALICISRRVTVEQARALLEFALHLGILPPKVQ